MTSNQICVKQILRSLRCGYHVLATINNTTTRICDIRTSRGDLQVRGLYSRKWYSCTRESVKEIY